MPTALFKTKVFLRSILGEGVWSIVQSVSPSTRHRLARLVQRQTKRRVYSGPFAGIEYLHDAVSGCYIPKLLGTYERELHPLIETWSQYNFARVVNIGASDGYYAVGLARCLPGVEILAFETEPRGQEFILKIAERNGVRGKMIVRGECDPGSLRESIIDPERTLVICDVEGYEDQLISPSHVPALSKSFLLVEVHDGKNAGVSDRIRDRFKTTHEIETIWQRRRTKEEFPFTNAYTSSLPDQELVAAVDEGRPVRDGAIPMSWLWMKPINC